MFPVNFKKARAEYFLDCLENGKAMTYDSEQGGWTISEMIGLAGACYFVIATHGPLWRKTILEAEGKILELSDVPEHAEADNELVLNDIRAALEWVAQLTQLVYDGGYDEPFEDSIKCGVSQDIQRDVERTVIPIQGFKQPP